MCPVLDIHPGYLGNQELIQETNLLLSLLSEAPLSKGGRAEDYRRLRRAEHKQGACKRYLWLLAELKFRGVKQEFPEPLFYETGQHTVLPESVNTPAKQFEFRKKTPTLENDFRIPLPKNHQQLWAQHKYSILARDVKLYRALGPKVALMKTSDEFSNLANQLTLLLRSRPDTGGIRNALLHMWGYVSDGTGPKPGISRWSLQELNQEIQARVASIGETYLLHSTALTELQTWLTEE